MSTATGKSPAPSWQRSALFGLGTALLLVVILAVTRSATGANDLTSSGSASAALRLAIPIMLAGLGGLWAERAGVTNIGLEGMMVLGAWSGVYVAIYHGPWAGVLAGIIGGSIGGVVHAVATVSLGVDHIVSGVAMNLLGPGIARYLSALLFSTMPGGGITQSPQVTQPATFTVPGLSATLAGIEKQHTFLVSDLAGILGGFVTGVSWVTVVALLTVPATYLVLWHTPFGLRLRSCGENPYAAESLGVNVYFYKYVAVIMSGACAGLGGAFLSLVASRLYQEGQTGGRGYIGLGAMIFGNWRPGGLMLGSALFSYTDALQRRQGEVSVHALLLALAIGLALLVLRSLWQRRFVAAGSALLGALAALAIFMFTDTVPQQFTLATPYITTLLVLGVSAQRLRMPAADGLIYRKGTAK